MKKKFKKLSLSTETLRTLTEATLENAEGGASTIPACGSNVTRVCTYCTVQCTICVP